MTEIIILALFSLLIISLFGYILATVMERQNLMKRRFYIDSDKVTQRLLDGIDLKMFRLGKIKLNIGDELKITTADKRKLCGILLGAKKDSNQLVMLTRDDEVVRLNIKVIKHLVITSKYGRLF